MSFYGNKLKKENPLPVNREQFPAPPTMLLGVTFGKWYHNMNVQLEVNMAVQNITEKQGEDDPQWVQ